MPAVHVSSDEPNKATDEHTYSSNRRSTVSAVPIDAFPRLPLAKTGRPGNISMPKTDQKLPSVNIRQIHFLMTHADDDDRAPYTCA